MPISTDPTPSQGLGAALRTTPRPCLTEILPAAPGDAAAALGFALAWAQTLCPDGLVVWAAPEASFAEEGAPCAEGLAQFGLALDRLLIVRARCQAEALWAGEQALKVPGALALVTIAPAKKALSLTATRRLLLAAEKHGARCVLLRLDAAGASAAWMRWRVAAAPSRGLARFHDTSGHDPQRQNAQNQTFRPVSDGKPLHTFPEAGLARELGAPAFLAHLARNRAGPAGFSSTLHWNAHARAFAEDALDGAASAAAFDRSAAARRQSA